jgi:uncharacterized protein YndB with AHSA1/START domain
MSVTRVERDIEALKLTLIAEFEAEVEEVWQLWADPRKLEKWWGPPAYPVTVETHALVPGGAVTYIMTSPRGDEQRGWWKITSVNPPHSLEFRNGFADHNGDPVQDLPATTVKVRLVGQPGGTRMELVTYFDSREHLDQLTAMGMQDGLTLTVGQMDALLKL